MDDFCLAAAKRVDDVYNKMLLELKYCLYYIPLDLCDVGFIGGPTFAFSADGPDVFDNWFAISTLSLSKVFGKDPVALVGPVRLLWVLGKHYIASRFKGVSS